MTTYDQKFGMKMIARTWRIFWSINWVKVVDFHNWSRYPYGYLTITKSSWIPVKWPIFYFSLISADSLSIKLHFKSVWQKIRRTRDSWTVWSFRKIQNSKNWELERSKIWKFQKFENFKNWVFENSKNWEFEKLEKFQFSNLSYLFLKFSFDLEKFQNLKIRKIENSKNLKIRKIEDFWDSSYVQKFF